MVMRKVLGTPGERFIRHLDEVERKAAATGTHPGGSKHMEDWEDWTWDRPDGTVHSVRDIDGELIGAVERIQDAEDALALTDQRLTAAETTVGNVQAELDGIDWENLDGAEVYTNGLPPINPTVGKALWVAPNGRVFRAIECEEHA